MVRNGISHLATVILSWSQYRQLANNPPHYIHPWKVSKLHCHESRRQSL